MEQIPKIFISFQSKIFSVLGQWSWLFILVIAAVVLLIVVNRNLIKDIVSAEKPRFYISDHHRFDSTFSENDMVKKMIENGEGNFINCAHCKHLAHCKKSSKTDYDIAETVCGDYTL